MENILKRYRSFEIEFNPGTTTEECKNLEVALNCSLPKELTLLYQNHNGTSEKSTSILPFRLMSIAEVTEFNSAVEEFGWAKLGLRVFWCDDNSNYAGLYVKGPLSGCICFIDHSETDLSPVYRSLYSFLVNLIDAAEKGFGWYDMPTEYPQYTPSENAIRTAEDWARAQALKHFFEVAEDEEEKLQLAYCIMQITPFEETDSLLDFLQDQDMYIQEKAAEIIGRRKYEAAVPQLAQLVLEGGPNGRIAAIRTLKNIGTKSSREKLQELVKLVSPSYKKNIEDALKDQF